MNKQEATKYIQDELKRNRPQKEIAAELSRQLNAPPDLVRKFVSQVAAKPLPSERPPAPQSTRPPSAEVQPALSQDELEEMIIKALNKDQRQSDIVMEVCEQTGMSWNQAQRLVAQVSTKNRGRLVSRQNMVIIPLAALALLAGLALIYASVSEWLVVVNLFDEVGSEISSQASEVEYVLREGLWGFIVGISLFLGGLYGLIRALQSHFD